MNAGETLSAEENAVYQANKADFDRVRTAGTDVFRQAVDEGFSTGSQGPDYWATRRNLASRYQQALPSDLGEFVGKQLRVDKLRLHEDLTPEFLAGETLRGYIHSVNKQRVFDPLVKNAQALRDSFHQLETTGMEHMGGEIKLIDDYVNYRMRGFSSPLDNEAFRRDNRDLAAESVGVGDKFKSDGLLHPLQPKGDLRVRNMDPQGRFQISINGKDAPAWYTMSDLVAMKREKSLVNLQPITSLIQKANTTGFYSWVGLRMGKFFPALASNIGRTLASESVGYTIQASLDIAKLLADPVARKAWIEELGPRDVLSSGIQEYLVGGDIPGKMQVAHSVAAVFVSAPDMLQKPILYGAAKLRLRDLHGPSSPEPWDEFTIQNHAQTETARSSDLSGRAYGAPASLHPQGAAGYLFQKAGLRTLDRITGIWNDKTMSLPKRMAKIGLITGIPPALLIAYHEASDGDLRSVFRQSLEFLPFMNIGLAFPGVAAVVDALSGKTIHTITKFWTGKNTPYVDAAAFLTGRPALHAYGQKQKRAKKNAADGGWSPEWGPGED